MGSLLGGLWAFSMGICAAPASEVPDALTSQAPAVAGLNGTTFVAWSGWSGVQSHTVWYSTLNGSWSPQAQIRDALTTAAPALGVLGQQVYLATTPPDSGDEIQFYLWNGSVFESGGTLCDGVTCAQTLATPALLGNGTLLYVAWTTPNGAIGYATFINGVWFIASSPVPNAATDPAKGPTLALYGNQLYVSWVDTSGATISTAVSTLPLSSGSWSTQSISIAAQTDAAPSMAVLTKPGSTDSQALYLAWTTAASTISFARLNTSAEWVASGSPIPLPAGEITRLAPALYGFEDVSPNQQCSFHSDVAYTGMETPHDKIHFHQKINPCP